MKALVAEEHGIIDEVDGNIDELIDAGKVDLCGISPCDRRFLEESRGAFRVLRSRARTRCSHHRDSQV